MTLVTEAQLYELIDMLINLTKVMRITGKISIHYTVGFLAWMGTSFAILRYAIGEFNND